MKKFLVFGSIAAAILFGGAFSVHAAGLVSHDVGHSMMHQSHQSGMHDHATAGTHEGHGGGDDLMQWDSGMSKHMAPMMQSITGMTQKLAQMMAESKHMSPERMKAISEMMDDLSSEMAAMSEMMFKNFTTEQDMHELHMKINETMKRFDAVR